MSDDLTPVQAKELTKLADDINEHLHSMEVGYRDIVVFAVSAGKSLIRAKEICGHGEWLPWLARNFDLSASTAQRYMLLANEAESNAARVRDLPLRNVRKGLIVPAAEKAKAPAPVDPDSDVGRMLAAGERKQLPPAPPAPSAEPAPPPPPARAPSELEAAMHEQWPPAEPDDDQHVEGGDVLEIPGVLTVAEERKFSAIETQLRDALNLLREATADGLNETAVAATIRDASHAARRAAMNAEDLASTVEARG